MTASRRCRYGSALVAVSLALTGCSAAMTSTPAPESSAGLDDSAYVGWPLKFKAHYFGASTYSTYGCKVVYSGMNRVADSEEVLQNSSESIGSKYPNNMRAGWGPIANFPPPATVTWRSKDGSSHEAEIDIGEIFKDELIRHNIAREDAMDPASSGMPGIILEVNDRTINVYMRAMIWLKEPRLPGRPHSDYQDDLIKVFSRSY